MNSSQILQFTSAGPVEIAVQDHDRSRTYLLLHGGGGVATMSGFADLLAERTRTRVLLPTHPGFNGTPKAAGLTDVIALAKAYVAMLDHLGVANVTVVGNSLGGWLAAEIALLHSPRVSRAVIVAGIGIVVDGHPLADVRGKTAAEIQQFSFHNPATAPTPAAGGSGPSPDVLALVGYTGPAMTDPTLAERLSKAGIPVHVLWGESDRIADPRYGEAYAAAIPGATFAVLPRTGHLPQVETPEELLGALLALDA